MKGTLTNTLRGLGFGALMATAFTLWITLVRIGGGDAAFERTGTPFVTTALLYYAGFSVGGALAGSLWSLLRRWAVGWAVMGFVLVTPVYAMFVIVNRPVGEPLTAWNIGTTLFGGAVVGGLAGLRVLSLERGGSRERTTNWRYVAIGLVIVAVLAAVLYLDS